YEIQIVIDCKDYNKPVDVKGIEEFYGLLTDVGAQKGVMVCPKGFTEAAKNRAEQWQIELYSPLDTDPHKWQVKDITIPAVCDFRAAAISFGLQVSVPLPLRIPQTFFSTGVAFDADGNELGTPLDNAMDTWNSGRFPSDPGTHHNLNVFSTKTV